MYAGSSGFISHPDDLIHQIIPPGDPWPSNEEGYADFNKVTQKPTSVPVVTDVSQITQRPVWVPVVTDLSQDTQTPSSVPFVVTDRIDDSDVSSSEEISPLVSIVTQQSTSTRKNDFHRDPWAGISSTEAYWLGSVQELPYP